MIKVIRHGHTQYKMTCRYCECVFTFEDSDIENNGCQRDWAEWVTCPECYRHNELTARSAFKYHQFE